MHALFVPISRETTHAERLKTGASTPATKPHPSRAPSFSPYRSVPQFRLFAHSPLRHHELHPGLSQSHRQLLPRLGVCHQDLHRIQTGNLRKRMLP